MERMGEHLLDRGTSKAMEMEYICAWGEVAGEQAGWRKRGRNSERRTTGAERKAE